MPTFSADSIINKSLIAKVTLNAYSLPSVTSSVLGSFKPGQTIGVVYSYINKPDGLYWMFYGSNKKPYYVKHKEGAFSVSSLREQGVLTTKEKIELQKEESKTLSDRLGETVVSFAGTLKWILIAAIIGLLLYYAYEAKMFKKLLK